MSIFMVSDLPKPLTMQFLYIDWFSILFIPVILLILFAAWFIAYKVYKAMGKSTNKWAIPVSILTFLVSGFIILIAVAYLVLSNMRYER